MKKTTLLALLLMSAFIAGCEQDKAVIKNDSNASKQMTIEEIPLVATNPLDELDLSLYTNDGYTIMGSHIWMDEKIPEGIVILGKQGEDCHICKGKIYAITFQFHPDEESGKNWQIKNETRFEELGSNGTPANGVIFLKLGTNNFGFATINEQSGQGYYVQYISIYGLINGNFHHVGDFDYFNQEGYSEGEYDYGTKYSETYSKIFLSTNPSQMFPDIRVKLDKYDKKKINSNKPVKKWEEIYIFKDGKYVKSNTSNTAK